MGDAVQEAAAAPQEVPITAEEAELTSYFVGQPAALATPGFALNQYYYGPANVTMNTARGNTVYGRQINSLNSLIVNSAPSVFIQKDNLVSTLMLRLVLNSIPANSALPRGWGYAAIRSLDYTMPRSTQSKVNISGMTHWVWAMEQCVNKEERSFYHRMAGEEVINNSAAPLNGPFEAYVMLVHVPFSKNGGIHQTLPWDTTMNNQDIQLQIYFNSANAFVCGAGGLGANQISTFSDGQLVCKEIVMFNKALQIGQNLMSRPNLFYNYPFVHCQSFPTPLINAQGEVTLNAQSFQDATLLAIGMSVQDQANLLNTDGNSPVNPFQSEFFSNVRVKYAGDTYANLAGTSWVFWMAEGKQGDPGIDGSFIQGTAGNFTSLPVTQYNYIHSLAFTAPLIFNNHFSNTTRVPQATIQFTFNLPNPALRNYNVTFHYWYNAVISTTNGGSNLFIY